MIVINNILEVLNYIENVDAVIFDLDDTLYSEKEYIKSGFDAVENYFKIDNMSKKLWDCFLEKKNAIDFVLEQEGLLEEGTKKLALEIYRNHFPKIKLYEGIVDILLQIKNNKKLGLITDGRPNGQRNKIKALDIEKYFDEIIITDELGGIEYRKPNSKAFELMQRKMNVSFEKMVYIGDNIKKDFIAPEILKMKSIFFRNVDGLYYTK